jgi:Protein of unknown function (DUF3352)
VAKSGGMVAALLVATAGSGAAYYYFQGQNVGDQPEQLAAAVPENAFMVGYVATDAKVWSKLEKFGTPEAQKLIGQSLTKFQQDTLAKEQVDFSKDIQPWLGNVMVAWLPSEGKASAPSLLMVSKVKDKISALSFLNRMKAKAKTPLKELDYKGTKILESGDQKTTYTTSLNDWVIMAGDRATIEKSIDTVNGATSFSKKNGNQFFASSSLSVPNPVASFYVDYAQLLQEIGKSGGNKVNIATFNQLNQVKSMAGGVGIDDQGLRLKMVAQTTDQVMKIPAAPGQVLANFPADTILLSSGGGLKEVWAETQKTMATQPELQQSLTQLRQSFQQNTKLDLDKDVFGWMGGEYALAIVPVNKGLLEKAGVGLSAVFDSTDKDRTNRTLQGLKSLASANGATTTDRKSNGQDLTDLKSPFGPDPILSYGWLNDRSIFVNMGDLDIKEPLNKSKDFQEITSSLPASNLGYLYINFERALGLMNTKLPPAQLSSIPPTSLAVLSSLRGLGATTNQNGNTIQMEGLLSLKLAAAK